MFEMFVVGPVAVSRAGLIGRCVDCQAARGANADGCPGFGDGCLARATPALDSDEAGPRYPRVTTSFW